MRTLTIALLAACTLLAAADTKLDKPLTAKQPVAIDCAQGTGAAIVSD
jgi:hypothetical protein